MTKQYIRCTASSENAYMAILVAFFRLTRGAPAVEWARIPKMAPLRAAVAAAVPEAEAAHARDPRLAASTPLCCPRRPHARPCPPPARVSTAPAWASAGAAGARPRRALVSACQGHRACRPTPHGDRGVRGRVTGSRPLGARWPRRAVFGPLTLRHTSTNAESHGGDPCRPTSLRGHVSAAGSGLRSRPSREPYWIGRYRQDLSQRRAADGTAPSRPDPRAYDR
jgi:hypothetical protein